MTTADHHKSLRNLAQLVFDSTVEGIWTIDLAGVITTANRAAVAMLGFARVEELIGRNSHELVHHQRADGRPFPSEDCPILRCVRAGEFLHLADEVLWRADGQPLFADVRVVPMVDQGRLIGAVITFLDTTEKRRTAEELSISRVILASMRAQALAQLGRERSKLRAICEQVPIPVALLEGPEHRFVFANASYRATFLRGRYAAGRTCAELRPEAVPQGFGLLLDKAFYTGKAVVGKEMPIRLNDRDGTQRTLILNFVFDPMINPQGNVEGILISAVEITEQIEARNILVSSKATLENERNNWLQLFEQSSGFVAVLEGPDLVYKYSNPIHDRLIGKEPLGRPLRAVVPDSEASGLAAVLSRVYRTGLPEQLSELPMHLDGELHYFDASYAARRDQQGLVDGVTAWGLDVTAQVLARKHVMESQTDLIDTLESMSDAFVSIDRAWRITRMNEHMHRLIGLPREEAMGRDFRQMYLPTPGDGKDRRLDCYEAAMLGRTTGVFEYYHAEACSWLQVRIYPKAHDGLAIFYTDITQRKAAEAALQASEHTFRLIAEATPQMVWTALPDGYVDYANTQWYAYTRLTPEETLGMGFVNAIHPEDRGHTLAMYQQALTSRCLFQAEHRCRNGAEGTYRWFLVRAKPAFDHDGNVSKWFGTFTDIHDQKLAAEELGKAKEAAERANQTKSAFLANMSHEIRTPLCAVMGYADLLRDPHLTNAERLHYLDTIARNSSALTRIIDDILDLAKVESGKMEVEVVDCSLLAVLSEVLDLFRETTAAKGIYLRTHLAPSVVDRIASDPTRLRQILINIIGNAVKFTSNGGVDIRVSTAAPGAAGTAARRFTIAVHDTGVGLTAEQASRLFQPFVQADNTTTRKFGGTGLGLALSRRLANTLGGDITIDHCAPEQGCTFVVSFLAAAVSSEACATTAVAAAAVRHPVPKLDHLKILVADDSPDNRFLVRKMLKRSGATVDLASDGAEALAMGKQGGYDLILMDIQMPVMDGCEATRMLRASGFSRGIVALTAHAMAEERARTKDAGCTGHLTKPINQAELFHVIQDQVATFH